MSIEFIERSLSEKVLKANLSYTRPFFRQISLVEELEGEFFICNYDVTNEIQLSIGDASERDSSEALTIKCLLTILGKLRILDC